jgi:hypothetical protein
MFCGEPAAPFDPLELPMGEDAPCIEDVVVELLVLSM